MHTLESTTPEYDGALNRRDFLKLAAVLAGSSFLLLGRGGIVDLAELQPYLTLPAVPAQFKRFILADQRVNSEPAGSKIAGYGIQCPNEQCVLLMSDSTEVVFHEGLQETLSRYTDQGQAELRWLD